MSIVPPIAVPFTKIEILGIDKLSYMPVTSPVICTFCTWVKSYTKATGMQ